MRDQMEFKLHKTPFFIGDLMLLGAAFFIYFQSKLPMGAWQIFFVVVCVAGGAWLGIMPFLLEYRLTLQLAQTKGIESALGQLQNLEQVAGQIGGATAQWQEIQEQAAKTATVAEAMGRRMAAEAKAIAERIGLKRDPMTQVRDLSVAEQQLVEIARALSMQSRLIIMDEPTAALSETEVANLVRIVRALKAEGLSIIFVTHRLDEVFRLCDRYTVLRDGHYVASGRVAETNVEAIIRMMVGRDVGAGAGPWRSTPSSAGR